MKPWVVPTRPCSPRTVPRHGTWQLLLGVLTGLALTSALPSEQGLANPETGWQAPLGRDHVLIGRVWNVASGQFIAEEALLDRLGTVRHVIAGESHNNPDHHRLQLRILEAMFSNGRRVTVGFELFTSRDQPALDHYGASHTADPDALLKRLGWGKRRRALWDLYLPLVRFAGEAGLPVVAMDLSRRELSAAKLQGLEALPVEMIERFGLDRPLPEKQQQTLVQDLFKAHCGMLFSRNLDGLLLAQRLRDATMAQRLQASDAGAGTLVLTGYGHARKDRGIPYLLSDLARQGALVSVLFASVKEDLVHPRDYAAWFGGDELPFDYVWFTPRVDNEDPCERLKRTDGTRKKGKQGVDGK